MTPEEIENLAQLARLELTNEEKTGLVSDMKDIFAFIDAIKEADVDIDTEGRVGTTVNVFREDDPPAGGPHKGGIHTDDLLASAPATERGYIKVNKIL